MPKLTLVVERTAQKVYDFDCPIIRVGREMGLEVVIDNAAVSRHQAEFRRQDMQWFVRDLGSGNGTLLNGRRLDGLAPIKRGDEISFGKFSLFFDHVPAAPAPQPYTPSRAGQQYEVRNTSWWYRMRVNDGPTRHATLRDGDQIAIGALRLTFKDDVR